MYCQRLSALQICVAVLFVAGAMTLHAAEPTPAPAATSVNVVIDAGKTSAPINPNLYGMFIEHAGNLVYAGMWAEMLSDRKFYYPVVVPGQNPEPAPERAPGRSRRGGVVRRWNPVGPAESVTMDAKNAYTGEHSPAVTLSTDEPRGIRQTGLALLKDKEYTGRVVLAGDPATKVSVSLIWGNGDTDRQTVMIAKLTPNTPSSRSLSSAPLMRPMDVSRSRPRVPALCISAPSR
jgi:alpha-N-arabinofuranosidase